MPFSGMQKAAGYRLDWQSYLAAVCDWGWSRAAHTLHAHKEMTKLTLTQPKPVYVSDNIHAHVQSNAWHAVHTQVSMTDVCSDVIA